MKIDKFAQLIKNIPNFLCCPQCNARYANKDLEILGFNSKRGVFNGSCAHCGLTSLAMLPVDDFEQSLINSEARTQQTKSKISVNDVIAMKNFLQKSQGDLNKIFSMN